MCGQAPHDRHRMLSAPIASQPLATALVEFAHQTGLQLLYESKLAAQTPIS